MSPHPRLVRLLRHVLSDIGLFSRLVLRRPLRPYQLAPARAIVASVLGRQGREFAVLFPRQSGKNETQAHIEAFLLNRYQRVPGASIIKAQPTFRPQALNARDRLLQRLRNPFNAGRWRARYGFQLWLGQASVTFLSAAPRANVAGATAALLLECDEAQDVLETEWDKKFIPMTASANATVVYWGTAWTSRTLLARTIRRLRQQEQADGQPRVFIVSPDEVRRVNPDYGAVVDREVANKGRQHPLVRTQFFNEELDAESGLFPPERRALMQGRHPRRLGPAPGQVYAVLLDVAGQDGTARGAAARGGALHNPRRDATALTVVEVELATLADPLLRVPTYRAVFRKLWRGEQHMDLAQEIRGLALHWAARYVVVDATGVGAGLASFLSRTLPPETVIEFTFSGASKSKLGWDFRALCDAGRWQDYDPASDAAAQIFWTELAHCQFEVLPGPGQAMRWGVPDGTLDEFNQPVHDDTVISAALVTVLDTLPWPVSTGPAVIIPGRDPLNEMSRGF